MYSQWIDRLKGIELFQGIDESELGKILTCSNPSIKQYKKKDIITMEHSKFTGIGIVLEGQAMITKDSVAGDRLIISRIKAGDIFGEVAAFVDNKWLETVIAETHCQILFLSPDRIIGICPHMCTGHRILIQNTLRLVSKKAFVLHKKVEMLSLKTIRNKISTYLLEQYLLKKTPLFEIPLTRNELAEYLNIPRPSLSRELSNMQDEGIIEFHKNSFKILELEILKQCA